MATHDWLEDSVSAVISLSVPVFVVATIGLWFLARPGGSPRWKQASVTALAAAGLALLVNQVISHLYSRPRPFAGHPSAVVLGGRSTDPSFPSDHASAAFAIAFAVFVFSRRLGAAFLTAAAAVAISRVLAGVHYPTDVLAGLGIGLVAALVVVTLAREPIDRVVALGSRISDPVVAPVRARIEAALRPGGRRRA
jgi:membrane-associated phospholipid phosphatase